MTEKLSVKVWKYLSSLTREEILALDKPANRAYVMTDLSYCDGVGNTLNTAQKDLITGDDFTEPGTHYFYAAVFGADGLLSLEKAAQTAYIAPSAGKLRFTREGSVLTGTFASDTEGEIETNYVFLSANGYAAVKEQLSGADRAALDALSGSGCALRFDNAGSTEFSLDLSEQKDLDGNAVDPARCYYVYVASASAETLMGVSYCAERFVTPEALPASSGTIGSGSGILFPNGGAASIGGDRSSIISTSQAIFRGFPNTPRVAVIGASSGSERELWSYFYQDTPSVRSFEHRFADAGFEAVYIPLTAENRDTIGSDAYFASLVSSCHGVYFTGGNQSLGIYALQNADGDWNAVGQAVQDLFARGGFLAGTSAGAHARLGLLPGRRLPCSADARKAHRSRADRRRRCVRRRGRALRRSPLRRSRLRRRAHLRLPLWRTGKARPPLHHAALRRRGIRRRAGRGDRHRRHRRRRHGLRSGYGHRA